MKAYSIKFDRDFLKEMRKVPEFMRGQIDSAIKSLSTDPRPNGCKKLKGKLDTYRIRVADYRVVYEINDKSIFVFIVRIGHRKDVYD